MNIFRYPILLRDGDTYLSNAIVRLLTARFVATIKNKTCKIRQINSGVLPDGVTIMEICKQRAGTQRRLICCWINKRRRTALPLVLVAVWNWIMLWLKMFSSLNDNLWIIPWDATIYSMLVVGPRWETQGMHLTGWDDGLWISLPLNNCLLAFLHQFDWLISFLINSKAFPCFRDKLLQLCSPILTTPIVTFWLYWQNHEVPNGLSNRKYEWL